MKCSTNEVMTLATKAARGAGAPPGQAAEFGRACAIHLTAARDAAALRAALDALPDGPILTHPLICAQLAEDTSADGAPAVVLCDSSDALMRSYLEAQPLFHLSGAGTAQTQVSLVLSPHPPKSKPARLTLPDDLAAHMQALAAKTLVPESAASRLSGAGAGLTDND